MNFLKKEDFKNKKYTSYIDERYDINSAIILNNIGRPKYIFVDGDKEYKVCRFCGKTQNEVTFENRSHVVPKFLGNFLVVSNFECDECNSYFSKLETELEKYVKIPLIANLKDRELKNRFGKNIQRVDGEITLNGEKEKVEFNSIYVLKILLKFAMSMMDEKDIKNYNNILKVLLNDNKLPEITNVLDITNRVPMEWNSVVLYETKDEEYVDNILILNFNMKRYIIFFNKDNNNDKIITNDIIEEKYIKLFKDLDIYNYRLRDFSNERMKIKFNLDIFMEFIKNKL